MNGRQITRLMSLSASLTLGIFAACGGSSSGGTGQTGGTISASSYDQKCTTASDCVPISAGPVTCCGSDGCDNAAINASDESKYEADLVADRPTDCMGVGCPAIACAPSPVACVGGMCTVRPFGSGDGGNGDSGNKPDSGPIACGTTTCSSSDVCVMNQFEGGALHPPSDAGTCPDGDVLIGPSCSPAPTYQCEPTPSACAAGLTCTCAQSLCDSSYRCMDAKDGLVSCYLEAP
jgi:hypothetical protein